MMTRWQKAFVLAVIFLHVGVGLRAEGLPKEAQKLVDGFQKKVTVTRLQLAVDRKKAIGSLIESLRTVQKKFTAEEKLDDAVAVRNYIRELEDAKKEGEYTAPSADQLVDLPGEAQKILLEQEPLDNEDEALEKELADDRETLVTKLTEMQATFTKNDKLDEALAIKEYLENGITFDDAAPAVKNATTPRKGTKITVPNIAKGTTTFEQINANYRSQQAEWSRQLEVAQRQTLDDLVKKLTQLQGVHSRAERLDQALKIKGLITMVESERSASAAMNNVRVVSASLPNDAKAACEKALRADDTLRNSITDGEKKIREQLVKPTEKEARRLLLDGKLEESRGMLASLCAVQQPPVPFQYLFPGRHEGPRAYSEEVVDIIEKFNDSAKKRAEAADVKEAELRSELLKALKALPGQAPSTGSTVAALERDDSVGLRGLVLFQRAPDLPEDAAQLVREYRNKTRELAAQLKTDMEKAAVTFKEELSAIRKQQVGKDELMGAFCTLLAESDPHYLFEPIPVKYSTRYGWDPTSDGKVLDIRDGFCLVLEWHGQKTWVPRELVVYGDAALQPKVSVPAVPPGQAPPPPGRAVSSKAKLSNGQKLMMKEFNGWTPVEVVKVSPGGVEVAYGDQRGPSFNKVVPREDLRDLSEE